MLSIFLKRKKLLSALCHKIPRISGPAHIFFAAYAISLGKKLQCSSLKQSQTVNWTPLTNSLKGEKTDVVCLVTKVLPAVGL